jgi:hypothetical protein
MTAIWWPGSPWSAAYFLARSAEHPAVLLLVAIAIIIVLAVKRPRHWIWWIAGTVIAAIVLAIFEREANRRRDRW